MYAQVGKTKENKSLVDVSSATLKKGAVSQCVGFVVNRSDTILQRQLNMMANNKVQSPQIIQRRIYIQHHRLGERNLDADSVYETYFGNNSREQRLCQATGSESEDIRVILQRYNQEDRRFNSIQHLEASVHNDLFQSFFRAGYHQRRAARGVGGRIPANPPENAPRMKVYRTMGLEEIAQIRKWASLQEDIGVDLIADDPDLERAVNARELELANPQAGSPLPVRNHLGGFDQANSYSEPGAEPKFLVEFTLTRNAPRQLQDHNIIALQSTLPNAIGYIHTWHANQPGGATPQDASAGEGLAAGRIGLKSENRAGEALSIAIGNRRETRELFQTMVSSIKLVKAVP